MLKQLTLDGKIRELQIELQLDGWRKQEKKQAAEGGHGPYLISGGLYDPRTDTITISLDALLEAVLLKIGDFSPNEDEAFIAQFSNTVSHEYIHSLINNMVSASACHKFDNIAEKVEEVKG